MFPWGFTQPQPKTLTPRELLLERLAGGVPVELACRAAGVNVESLENDAEANKAIAEGEIRLFEQARDSGVTGTIRAAMRYEGKSWMPKAEPAGEKSLEDYLRD